MNKTNTDIYIKNMVCPHCLFMIRKIFTQEGISIKSIHWDKAAVKVDKLPHPYPELVRKAIEPYGFKIITSNNDKISEQIKIALIKWIYFSEEVVDKALLIEFIEKKLQTKYSVLNPLFKKMNGYSICNYFDLLRLERLKELVSYDKNSFSAITLKLGFDDRKEIQHLIFDSLNCSISEFIENSMDLRRSIGLL